MENLLLKLPQSSIFNIFSQIDDIEWKLKMCLVNRQWHAILWRHSAESWGFKKCLNLRFSTTSHDKQIIMKGNKLVFSRDRVFGEFASEEDCQAALMNLTNQLGVVDTLHVLVDDITHRRLEVLARFFAQAPSHVQLKNMKIQHQRNYDANRCEYNGLLEFLLDKYSGSLQCLSGNVLKEAIANISGLPNLKHLKLDLYSERRPHLSPLSGFLAKMDQTIPKTLSLTIAKAYARETGRILQKLPACIKGVSLTFIFPDFFSTICLGDESREKLALIQYLTVQLTTCDELRHCGKGQFLKFLSECENLKQCDFVAVSTNGTVEHRMENYLDCLKHLHYRNVRKDIQFTLHIHQEKSVFVRSVQRFSKLGLIWSEFTGNEMSTAALNFEGYKLFIKAYGRYEHLKVRDRDIYADHVF